MKLKIRKHLALFAAIFAFSSAAGVVVADEVEAWHVDPACTETNDWTLTAPIEWWSTDTTFIFTFDDGTVTKALEGETKTAPKDAKSVIVTYTGSDESDPYERPADCNTAIVTSPPTTVTSPAPTTTMTPPSTTIAITMTVVTKLPEVPATPIEAPIRFTG